MTARHSNGRFRAVSAWNGSVRLMREVVVERDAGSELFVLSATPAIVDEVLGLDVTTGDRSARLKVRVLGSRPVVIDGSVKHQLQLKKLETT